MAEKEKKTSVVPTKVNAVALAKDLKLSVGELQTIQNTVAKGATVEELKLFLFQAKRTGLDPFSRQIHFVKRGDRPVIQTGIDGYRAIAEKTGKYAGNDEPVFETDDKTKKPIKASVTVWKIVAGQRVGFTASARWEEYYPGDNLGFMWKAKPFLMLSKCAEALALRKAFPQDLSGLYVKEELDKVEESPDEILSPFRDIVKTAIRFAETCGEDRVADLRGRMDAAQFTPEERKAVEDVLAERFPPNNVENTPTNTDEPKPENETSPAPADEDTTTVEPVDEIPEEDNPFNKKKAKK